uniref:SWI/SNF complex subunit SMARCC2 n=2 Tax=Macrostomum lignano TaxID=282301 RepID=A0A1I8JI61_9PLAT
MSLQRKKDTAPSQRFFEHPEVIAEFDTVRTWLTRNHKKLMQTEPPTNKSLASICYQLLCFQEEQVRRQAKSPPYPTRLPGRLFLDFQPGGALCQMFLTVFRFKGEQGWRRLDFHKASWLEKNLEMLALMRKELLDSKLWSLPRVHIKSDVPEDIRTRLLDICQRHGLELADTEDACTHLVYGPASAAPAAAAQQLLEDKVTPAFKEGKHSVVHWKGTVSSYDVFYTSPAELEVEVTRCVPDGPWELDAAYLLTLDEQCEFPPEEDFLVEYQEFARRTGRKPAAPPRYYSVSEFVELKREKKIQKRKRSPSPPASSTGAQAVAASTPSSNSRSGVGGTAGSGRKSSAANVSAAAAASGGGAGGKKARRETGASAAASATGSQPSGEPMDAEAPGGGSGRAGGGAEEDADATAATVGGTEGGGGGKVEDGEDEHGQTAAGGDVTVTEQAHVIIVPSYATWFDYNSIHALEERGLPEFFTKGKQSKTPEAYLAYRNFMIDTYRLNPQEYLTFTACRRNLHGDVCGILRVHAFLEQWGLINYQVDNEAKLAALGPPSTSHFHVLADTPAGLAPVNPPFKPAPPFLNVGGGNGGTAVVTSEASVSAAAATAAVPASTAASTTTTTATVTSNGHGVSSAASAADSPAVSGAAASGDSQQGSGTGVPGGTAAIQSQQQQQQAPSAQSAAQSAAGQKSEASSKQPDKPPASRKSDWTDQETLSLLEGLELFKDDWNRVAEHVGSRTQEECVLHFLKLPIEDPFLEGAEEALGPLIHQPIPFSKAGNPIMCTVAFLAATVDPRIASAATKAALDEYAKMRDEIPNCVLKAHQQSVGANKEASAAATSSLGNGAPPAAAADKSAASEDAASAALAATADAAPPAAVASAESAGDAASVKKEGDDSGGAPAAAASSESVAAAAAKTNGDEPVTTDPAAGEAAKPKSPPAASAAAAEVASTEAGDKEPADAANETSGQPPAAAAAAPADPKETMSAAAASVLAAAAVKAKHLAQVEEKKIKSLVASLVETQMKKIETKLRHFQELEALMDREREVLEAQRQQLLQERQAFYQEMNRVAEQRARQLAAQEVRQQQQQQQLAEQTAQASTVPTSDSAMPPPPPPPPPTSQQPATPQPPS